MPTIDHYITPLKMPMTIDLFSRFPALAGYRTELKGGNLELTYSPRLSMARLRVASREVREVEGIEISLLDVKGAHDPLAKLFATSFAHVPPLDTMAPTTRRHAADAAMKHTAAGGDGPLFEPACFGAVETASRKLIGAAIVCVVHLRKDEWPEDPMPVTLVNLTWLFVSPDHQRARVGSALLGHVVNALAERDLPWLVSHIPQDNVPVVMFHWRSGFELVQRIAKPWDVRES